MKRVINSAKNAIVVNSEYKQLPISQLSEDELSLLPDYLALKAHNGAAWVYRVVPKALIIDDPDTAFEDGVYSGDDVYLASKADIKQYEETLVREARQKAAQIAKYAL